MYIARKVYSIITVQNTVTYYNKTALWIIHT